MPKHQDLKGPFSEYRKRRVPGATPEPFDDTETPFPGGPRRFVVQVHAARNLHFDLRLEIAGALHSWALPKGLPATSQDAKRAAFETEDHPLADADFEGIIPPGNYGAGAMIGRRWRPSSAPARRAAGRSTSTTSRTAAASS